MISYSIQNDLKNQLGEALLCLENDIQKASSIICNLHPADIADLIDNSVQKHQEKIIKLLYTDRPEIICSVLIELHPKTRDLFFDSSFDTNLIFVNADANQVTYIIEDLDDDQKNLILEKLSTNLREEILKKLAYPNNSAGRLMHKNFASVYQTYSIEETLEYLRKKNLNDFNEVFVCDEKLKPVGILSLSNLIKAQPNLKVSEVMKKNNNFVLDDETQEQVNYICCQYGLISVAVVDKNEKMIGVISHDDVINLVEEEVEADLMKIAGIVDISDLHTAFLDTIKNRLPWLIINLLVACITSVVISFFQDTIHKMVVLAAVMPIVASMGGNAGTQTLTVIVRAIAHRDLPISRSWKVILKEILALSINGIILALVGALILLILHNDINLSIIFSAAVVINFAIAGFLGSFIPIALSRLGIDPATASVVFLTALTDIIGFFAFLWLAKIFLP